jgi:hypothetical protein
MLDHLVQTVTEHVESLLPRFASRSAAEMRSRSQVLQQGPWKVRGVARFRNLTIPVDDIFYAFGPQDILSRLQKLGYTTDGVRIRPAHRH